MLTVAVTGPTGEIGKPFVAALERLPEVGRIVGMGRRYFDPESVGWRKFEYLRGDILDRGAVEELVAGADVVVHLAFAIIAGSGDTREVNLRGSRNVFEATAAAGPERLVYTSSVAAYGFHRDLPGLLTEDLPVRGTDRHPYSADKAAVEEELKRALDGSDTSAYVFRPCIVAGPDATLLLDAVPLLALAQRIPGPLRWALGRVPELRPVLPDPGVRFQLVHQDDVAAALVAAVLGHGEPGVYNLAGPGELTVTDFAHELGWHAVPAPQIAVGAAAEAAAMIPFLPDEAAWIEAIRRPMLMDTSRARHELRWVPHHDARETLREAIAAVRARR
jgi:nucleoside-diphosphate-sugar epimerase